LLVGPLLPCPLPIGIPAPHFASIPLYLLEHFILFFRAPPCFFRLSFPHTPGCIFLACCVFTHFFHYSSLFNSLFLLQPFLAPPGRHTTCFFLILPSLCEAGSQFFFDFFCVLARFVRRFLSTGVSSICSSWFVTARPVSPEGPAVRFCLSAPSSLSLFSRLCYVIPGIPPFCAAFTSFSHSPLRFGRHCIFAFPRPRCFPLKKYCFFPPLCLFFLEVSGVPQRKPPPTLRPFIFFPLCPQALFPYLPPLFSFVLYFSPSLHRV